MTADPKILALRQAEGELKRCDERLAEVKGELTAARRDRDAKQRRLQECIDLLLGRGTPSLFDGEAAPEPATEPEPDRPVDEPCAVIVGPPPAEAEAIEPPEETTAPPAGGLPDRLRDVFLLSVVGPSLDHVVKKLDRRHELTKLGEFWDWVEEDGAVDGGMADPNGLGLWACLRGIGVGDRTATKFADQVYAFLAKNGADPRPPKPLPPPPASPIERLIDEACGVNSSPPPPPAESAFRPKGEPIGPLGLSRADLDAATCIAGYDARTKPAVKPVAVNGRRYVVTGINSSGGGAVRQWELLPLHTPVEFSKRHPAIHLRDGYGFPNDDRKHPAGFYGGLVVTAGRGKAAERLVVGVKNEQRLLLWEEPPAVGPLVCAPVGAFRLRDVANFPPVLADLLEEHQVVTLLDLDRYRPAVAKRIRREDVPPHELLRECERQLGLSFPGNILFEAGDALVDHLTVKIPVAAPAAKGKKKGKVTK